ncbi:DUF5074 domain-containing protein [Marinilabiliaceae bacterium JC040]|nr:DUF5074 domain-containing protein [Marinilabiliaceae bacterium JC040]
MKKKLSLSLKFILLLFLVYSCSEDSYLSDNEPLFESNNIKLSTISNNLPIDYKNGVYVVMEGNMSDQNGSLSFIDNSGKIHPSIYFSANKTYVGNVLQDVYVYDNKIYMITQNGSKNGGDGRFVVADAKTMKREKIYSGSGINDSKIWPQHITVINKDKAYIRYSTSDLEKSSGIRIFNFKSGKLSSEDINGTRGAFTVSGSTKIRMVLYNNKVFAPCGHDLCIIDTKTDKIIKRISFKKQIKGIVKGHDGNIWMTIAGTYTGNQNWGTTYTSPSTIVGINPTTYNIIKTVNLPSGMNFPVATWTPSIGMSASYTENAIFFWNGPFKAYSVYRYDINTGLIKELINIENEEDLSGYTVYGYVGTDNKNNLYIGTTNYLSTKIIVIDSKTGKRKDIRYLQMDKDQDNKIDNYYFINSGSPSGIDSYYRFK